MRSALALDNLRAAEQLGVCLNCITLNRGVDDWKHFLS